MPFFVPEKRLSYFKKKNFDKKNYTSIYQKLTKKNYNMSKKLAKKIV